MTEHLVDFGWSVAHERAFHSLTLSDHNSHREKKGGVYISGILDFSDDLGRSGRFLSAIFLKVV